MNLNLILLVTSQRGYPTSLRPRGAAGAGAAGLHHGYISKLLYICKIMIRVQVVYPDDDTSGSGALAARGARLGLRGSGSAGGPGTASGTASVTARQGILKLLDS